MRKPPGRATDLLRQLKKEFETPEVSKFEARREWVLDRRAVFSTFADLAIALVREFHDWRLVFIERDACPIKHLAEHEARLNGLALDSVALPLAREMLPTRLLRKLDGIPQNERAFDARRTAIYSFVSQMRDSDYRVLRMVTQTVGDARRVVVVDTGYWGTMPLFVLARLGRSDPPPQTDWRLVVGPPAAPCLHEEIPYPGVENSWALAIESISHPYILYPKLHLCNSTGRVFARRREEEYRQEWYAGELRALEELLLDRRESGK